MKLLTFFFLIFISHIAICNEYLEVSLSFFNRPLSSVISSNAEVRMKCIYELDKIDALKYTSGVSFCINIKNISSLPLYIYEDDFPFDSQCISFEIEDTSSNQLFIIRKKRICSIVNSTIICGRLLYPGYSMLIPISFNSRDWNIGDILAGIEKDKNYRIRANYEQNMTTVVNGELIIYDKKRLKSSSQWYNMVYNTSFVISGQSPVLFNTLNNEIQRKIEAFSPSIDFDADQKEPSK